MTTEKSVTREEKTITSMIEIFCRDHHGKRKELCDGCLGLLEYAKERLRRCPFREKKPTCANCTVHCYKPEMKTLVREVMRYSGPRMLRHHPVLALAHLVEGLRKPPDRKK